MTLQMISRIIMLSAVSCIIVSRNKPAFLVDLTHPGTAVEQTLRRVHVGLRWGGSRCSISSTGIPGHLCGPVCNLDK